MSDKWCTECEHLGTGEGLCTSCVDDKNFEPKGDRRTRMTEYKYRCCFYNEFKDMGSSTPVCLRYEDYKIGECPCEKCDVQLDKTDAIKIIRNYINGKGDGE